MAKRRRSPRRGWPRTRSTTPTARAATGRTAIAATPASPRSLISVARTRGGNLGPMRSRKFPWQSGWLVLAVVVSWAPAAVASPSARLVYVREQGAESCPDEDAVRSAVAARLGYDPFFPTAPSTMFVEISRANRVFRAHIKLVDAANDVRGVRELKHAGPRCEDMIDMAALSMSVAIDPDSMIRGPAPPAPDARPATAPPPPTPAEPPPPARASEDAPIAPISPTERVHVDVGI